jgi:dTDP-glucose 4,6-dehydratase
MRDAILVTGGCGFIGSNFVRSLLASEDFKGIVVNVDKLTYAGRRENLADVEKSHGGRRYRFEQADICDASRMRDIFRTHGVDTVVHFAAESHVDRSIDSPMEFIQTNIVGTCVLLQSARAAWADRRDVRFHHVSTDEVYGSLGDVGRFEETTPYHPNSPYSASKAASDHLVQSYGHTYGLPVTVSNCSNNYGPYQFPEKMIPVVILNLLAGKPIPVYGDGRNVRDWVFVDDHNDAIWRILTLGVPGEGYNIGGENEWQNIDLVRLLCRIVAEETGADRSALEGLITFVADRPGHDRRYAIDCRKAKRDLAWEPRVPFEEGLRRTVRWYRAAATAPRV